MESKKQEKIEENISKKQEDLDSRQLAPPGKETQAKIQKERVLIYGMRGVGVETAKNIILAGAKLVVIHDDEIAKLTDMASNFYITEEDIGKKTRADACLKKLSELNPSATVSIHKGEITLNDIKNFDVVVFTEDYERKKLIEINEFCKIQKPPITFIYKGGLEIV